MSWKNAMERKVTSIPTKKHDLANDYHKHINNNANKIIHTIPSYPMYHEPDL